MQKIMFNDRYGLTQAVIEGRKTMTRRLIPDEFFGLTWDTRGNTLVYENEYGDFIDVRLSKYTRYKVGEIVAVAQRYQDIFDYSNCVNPYAWEDDDKPSGWTNKMLTKAKLMPHQIRITGIKCERLQDISDEDCIKEGLEWDHKARMFYVSLGITNTLREWLGGTPREAFASLTDMISGSGTWESNLFVTAYEFELVK